MTGRIAVRWVCLGLAAVVVAGCSRQAYRERTDKDVEALISQKNVVPQWKVQNWHVYPDPRARFADPSNPDFPPYPPDDYAAKVLSPNPQRPGRGGAGRHEGDGWLKQLTEWDAQNRAEDDAQQPAAQPPTDTGTGVKPASAEEPNPAKVEAPADDPAAAAYKAALTSTQKPYRIRLDQAVELALYNSREFQDRREDLYLAALPVSLERFSFSAQAFAAEQVILEAAGRETATPGTKWRINSDVGVTRQFATGASLLVQLANRIVIDLSNGRPTVSTSTLGLTLVQPFLRGGGFAVTLEALTLAERTLLYAIRSYARFRSIFYVAVSGQGDYTNNPYGLQGLSPNLGRGIGANLTANPVGYLPTVLRSAVLANERKNVATFEQYQRLFQNLEEGGAVTKLQVGRIEQQLLQGRATVLLRSQEYIDNIDNFKLQLGIPATVPLELDESPLKPIRDQLRRIEEVYDQFRQLEAEGGRFDPKEDPATLRDRWRKLLTDSPLVRGTELAKDFPKAADDLRGKGNEELERVYKSLAETRRKLLDDRAAKLDKGGAADAETRQLEAIETALDRVVFEQALRRYESKPWAGLADPARREGEQASVFRAVLNTAVLVAVPARTQRLADIRDRWPKVPAILVDDQDLIRSPLDVAYEKVAAAALTNRLDLMNARAQVVDAWRQVTVRANALQGVLDVEYDLSTNSPAGTTQALSLGGSRTLHQIRLRLEPPFVRRAERNQYRAALISYQRQRRNLMAFEDNIVTDVRTDLRALRQLEQTFLVQQRAVELAYLQVDNARGTLSAPPDPRADASAGAAAQTEQLLQVQAALVRAQNDLYTVWVRYLNARMTLHLDLELVPLDARGIWSDDASPAAQPAPPSAAPGQPVEPGTRSGDRWRAADAGVPGPGRVDGGPVRAPGDAAGGAAVRRDGPDRVAERVPDRLPERLPEPDPLPTDRSRLDPAPVLSLPDPDAQPRRLDPVRADPFPPIELPPQPVGAGADAPR